MTEKPEPFVFVPLGGLGEIGMNAALYGYGEPHQRKWIMIDCGVAFAGPDMPGVDLLMPDVSWIEERKRDLLGLVITHAHEDHIGALPFLWPKLRCPLYCGRFAADLVETRRLGEPGAPKIPLHVISPDQRLELGPFSLEFLRVAHSIPEALALAIRTPAGLAVHTGDWKIDATPVVGWATDEQRLRAIGDEGALALICDSTNILRDGESPSETDVAATLRDLIASAPARVVVTTFASNVARLRAVAQAALASRRMVVVVGRAMERVSVVARELGYLDGLPDFLSADALRDLSRERVVILATGSQGEPRAAMARIAADEHPAVKLASGDRVIFSSRPIPGNEKAINEIVNGLIAQNIEVVTDRTNLVHVSGHPRRAEVAKMYDWVRPQIAVPAHGEELHLHEHAAFAKARGVPHVLPARNGVVVQLAPNPPGLVDEIAHGRMVMDGSILAPASDEALRQRRRLSFAGVVSLAVAINAKGDLVGDPDVTLSGLPARTADGRAMDEIVDKAVFETLDTLPRARRRDADSVVTALERGVRSAVGNVWGKRPQVHALVIEV